MNKNSGKIIILFCLLAGITLLVPEFSSKKTSYDIVMFGDSIFGNFRDETSIPSLIGERFNMTCLNAGLGGTTMAYRKGDEQALVHENASSMVAIAEAFAHDDFSYVLSAQPARSDGDLEYFDGAVESISQAELENTKLIVIEHGLNDYFYGMDSGYLYESDELYNYRGALSYVVENLQTKYPNAKILLASPVYGQENVSVYAAIMYSVSEKYGVYFCDMNEKNIVNADNLYEVTDDGTHLNEKGRRLYADVLAEFIETNHILGE